MPHTIEHALHPEQCHCWMSEITQCVICGKTLGPGRAHTDTCGEACFKALCRQQRTVRA